MHQYFWAMFPDPLTSHWLFGHVSGPWDDTLDLLLHASEPLEGTLVLLGHVSCPANEILYLVDHSFCLIDKKVGVQTMCLARYTRQRPFSAMSLDRCV